MKKMITIMFLAAIAIFGNMTGIAFAVPPANGLFTNSPTSAVDPNASSWVDPAPYTRNVYWNLASAPAATGAGATDYYGGSDTALKSGDSFSKSSTTTFFTDSGSNKVMGLNGTNHATGTATFNLANFTSNTGPGPVYVWAEFDIQNLGSSIALSVTGNGTGDTVTSWGSNATGTSGTVTWTAATAGEVEDAWFKITGAFPSVENLTFTFTNGNGSGNTVTAINNLHVAVTPEPMALALFATGVGVLFFFGRRRLKLQAA